MGNPWTNESNLEKWVTLGKMGHIRNKGRVTHEKMYHTSKNWSPLGKWVKLRKVRHHWKNVTAKNMTYA